MVQLRRELGRPAGAPVVVVSRRASLAPGDRLAVPSTYLVTCGSSDADRRAALAAAGVRVLVCGDDDVDLPAALEGLRALYRQVSGGEHDDWDDFDAAMHRERRVLVRVHLDRAGPDVSG